MLNFKIGDFIIAYRKGFHVIVSIQERDWSAPLIGYRQFADQNGKEKVGRKIYYCDASYCSKLDDEYFNKRISTIERIKQCLRSLQSSVRDVAQ